MQITTDINWHAEIARDFVALIDNWQIKATISAALTGFIEWLGMDQTLVVMALSLLFIETILRLAFHLRHKRSRLCRAMQKSIARFFYYFTTLSLVIFVEATIAHSYGVTIPLADAVLGLLMLTELTSVISFLRLLGYNPPAFLDSLISFWKGKFKSKVTPPGEKD